jgi:hypothetical protein
MVYPTLNESTKKNLRLSFLSNNLALAYSIIISDISAPDLIPLK